MNRPTRWGLGLGLALLLAPLTAAAQQIDFSHGGPVEVTARGGFEWRENEHVVIASGDARAVRGDVTVLADRLLAYYRKKAAAGAPAATAATARQAADLDSGASEIYRLEAEGHVRIFTPTDQAEGDRAVYDLDQAVLVMTGQNLKLTTPQQVLTARDSMEYWSEKHMAVGRGAATVLTSDGRRLSADVLVAYTKSDDAARPTPASAGGAESGIASSGKLERIEAYGNVEVRTAVDTVRGDRGLYLPDSGIARIFGHVRITHGHNQLNGPLADINLKTGVAHLASSGSQQVEGLIMPKEATTPAPGGASPAPRAGRPLPAAQP